MKHVVISLLNFNGKKNTLECLGSLKNIKRDNFRLTIMVVDNASTDGSVESIKHYVSSSKHDGIKVIENKENLGFSGGHNVTIEYMFEGGADYVLILNNDTYVQENFLEELLKVGEQDNAIGILIPKIYFAPGFEFHKDRYSKEEKGKVLWYAGGEMDWANVIGRNRGVDLVDKGQFDETEETQLATGCCMLIKKEVIDMVGMLDNKYFLYYD